MIDILGGGEAARLLRNFKGPRVPLMCSGVSIVG